ncbi:STAS/SEC14 domain-containing protein [Caenimonas aquaedulcis]|uniref:STAS/SEC14 domain-containing protein n=1 Tax=Caenimonas aquaedulcis TaxID=2793270 RepID=A0A931H1Z2_9BURK|nr:STAS/SEC14 domain-containing protein [Caenimonas aquaedulcis]MBG9387053.1 STAS/SEC14 domain-containing protein [Caenimonas aquaedulcis]
MPVTFTVEHRSRYSVVRVDGEPDLNEFLTFVERLGVESAGWGVREVLVDMRTVRSLKTFTEHYAIGESVARHLAHLRKMASVVPADRVTRASEKTAKRSGVNLTVFTTESEAIEWLLSADS